MPKPAKDQRSPMRTARRLLASSASSASGTIVNLRLIPSCAHGIKALKVPYMEFDSHGATSLKDSTSTAEMYSRRGGNLCRITDFGLCQSVDLPGIRTPMSKCAAVLHAAFPAIIEVVPNFVEGVSSTHQCTEANAVILASREDVNVICHALFEAAATPKTNLDD
ncbi:RNA directed DNA polymerase (reverse transcriptase) [Echinococcus multilocularis]|uniref:RNA directed DNA polymerase (Reverse transcriptase) n=1 Tax=Echinococcus multilocularis TaxID=6211 RepID=A0A0S4MM04_ECHMU|nr:RNA directed DNA polymerase (reverse transcriptase) [Echinococcus multilocularis]